jgi:hypothetical protein
MAPPVLSASALVAAAAFERLSASAPLGLRHAALLVAIAAVVPAAAAPAAPETLVALAPVGFEIAPGNRAGRRRRLA